MNIDDARHGCPLGVCPIRVSCQPQQSTLRVFLEAVRQARRHPWDGPFAELLDDTFAAVEHKLAEALQCFEQTDCRIDA